MKTPKDRKILAKKYKENRAKARKGKPYRLTLEQFNMLLIQFYAEAEKHGFYLRLEDAIENNGYFFTAHQRVIAVSMLKAVFMKIPTTINVSITRQFGKTELVTLVVSFCYEKFYGIFGEAFKCCVIAPEKLTAGEVFKRASNYIEALGMEMLINRKDEKETIRGDVIQLFGIYEDAKGGTIEGRTYNLIIRDEAHLGDDGKFSDQVEPTVMRTDGSTVFIGNGAERDCAFRRNIDRGDCDIIVPSGKIGKDGKLIMMKVGENKVFRFTYTTLKPYMQDLADKGLNSAQAWINGTEKYIFEKNGTESIVVRKNIFCQFMTNLGNFLSIEQLKECRRKSPRLPIMLEMDLYLGIDFAYSGDRTIATFLNKDRQIEDWVVLKDNNEVRTFKDQCKLLYNYCKERNLLSRLAAIGGDSTGLGIGAIEYMVDVFQCEILPYNFTQRKKHEWYTEMRDLMMTSNERDRIYYNPDHEYAPMFEKEMTEMEIIPTKSGFLSFQAPQRHGFYDDFPASLAIANNMRALNLNLYADNPGPRTTEEVSYTAEENAMNLRRTILGENCGFTRQIQ